MPDERYRSEYLSPLLPVELKTTEPLIERLADQIAASHSAAQVLHEVLTVPDAEDIGCQAESSRMMRELSEHVELLSWNE